MLCQKRFFNNYFTIDDDSMEALVSIKPVEKNMTCKEMFGSTCRKVKVDSVGNYADSVSYLSCVSDARQIQAILIISSSNGRSLSW